MENSYILDRIDAYNRLPKNKKIEIGVLKEYVKKSIELNSILDNLTLSLNSFEKGAFGLIKEEARVSDEYKKHKQDFNVAFKKSRDFNVANKEISAFYNRHFKYINPKDLNLDLLKEDSLIEEQKEERPKRVKMR